MKFTTDTQNTNILIVTVPHRHDLQEFSCVNKEIKLFKSKLQKIMKIKGIVKIIQTDLSRNDFTRHGMHLNASGKEKTVELIGRTINLLGKEHDESPIVLKWLETDLENLWDPPTSRLHDV
jgi:hypothetical protein